VKLDRTKPFGTVVGHKVAKFEQNGLLFNASGELVDPPKVAPVQPDLIVETDQVDSGRLFLLNILKGGPLSKSAVYKIAEENNQSWDSVNKAATLLGVVKFSYNKATMWKLPEEAGAL
jgi:hypothetical protein